MKNAPEPATPFWTTSTPALSRGAHLSPSDGACLMEAVSLAARASWSDSPTCTHTLVAHLARLVNDAMSPAGRQQLAALIPQLMIADAGDPETAAHTTARLATACTERALRIHSSLFLVHLHHVALAALQREERVRAQEPRRAQDHGLRTLALRVLRAIFGNGQSVRAVEASVLACLHLDEAERDRALLDLLRTGLSVSLRRQPESTMR